MSGTVTATRTGDWLTPFEVTVAIEGRQPTVAHFISAAQAQRYMVEQAAEHDLDLAYDLDAEPRGGEPRRITAEEFQQRIHKRCSKCRESKPLATFRSLYHRNKSTGRSVHHGWAERCQPCEEAHGE